MQEVEIYERAMRELDGILRFIDSQIRKNISKRKATVRFTHSAEQMIYGVLHFRYIAEGIFKYFAIRGVGVGFYLCHVYDSKEITKTSSEHEYEHTLLEVNLRW